MGKINYLQEANGMLLAMKDKHCEGKDGLLQLQQAQAYGIVAAAEQLKRIADELEAANNRGHDLMEWQLQNAGMKGP